MAADCGADVDLDYHDLIEELARLRYEAMRWKAAAEISDQQVTMWMRRVVAVEQHSRIAILTRLVGHLQDEIAARDTVLRVIEEARE